MPDAQRVLWRGKRHLPFQITPEELTLQGRVIGEKMEQRRQLDEERLEAMADFKARRESLDKAIADIGRTLQTGTELREVDCETLIDDTNTRAETVRTDTGEVVDFRPLTPEERQREMFRRNSPPKDGQGGIA
jgi:hypothetical protein